MVSKIMIVDNHVIVREGLKLIFETNRDYNIEYEAIDGQEAIALLKIKQPDLILLDIKMPNIDGFGVMNYVNDYCPEVPVVVLSTIDNSQDIKTMLKLGAKSYLLKDASTDVIFNTVSNALKGNTILQYNVTEIVRHEQRNMQNNFFQLESLEVDLLTSLAQGKKIKQIAVDQHFSERTVKNNLTKIYSKLGVSSGLEAVALAVKNDLITF